jgi:hypothetical protein
VIFGVISVAKPAEFLKSAPYSTDGQTSTTVPLVAVCGLDGKRDLTTWHGMF